MILMLISMNDVNFRLSVSLAADRDLHPLQDDQMHSQMPLMIMQVFLQSWWVEEDLNLRPHAYQACALTT